MKKHLKAAGWASLFAAAALIVVMATGRHTFRYALLSFGFVFVLGYLASLTSTKDRVRTANRPRPRGT